MFADYVKMGAKLALIAVVTVAVLAIFNTIQIPSVNFAPLMNGVRSALAIVYHWIPGSDILVPLAATMIGIRLSITVFEFAMIAVRWVFKVNE